MLEGLVWLGFNINYKKLLNYRNEENIEQMNAVRE